MVQSVWFWIVLGLSVPVFWLLPRRFRPGFLAMVSFGYLATVALLSTCALLGWTLAFYALGPQMIAGKSRRRTVVTGLILAIIGYLAYFKYIPPLIAALSGGQFGARVLVPLGISYYTFKLIHYAAEVARGNIKDRSLERFLCYMYLFPIFTAGPIERFDHFLENAENRWQLRSTVEGLTRIVRGLIKKFVVAELLTWLVASLPPQMLLSTLGAQSTGRVWVHMFLMYFYNYLDFSAYTDIAIGCSRLYGLHIMENFNFPFIARNIADFWRRWHRTLSTWCQNYVYMPILGKYRRPYLALYASLIVFGLWHAGTPARLFWGVYHASIVAAYTIWTRQRRKRGWKFTEWRILAVPEWLLTQSCVAASMVFLIPRGDRGLYDALRLLGKLFFVNIPAWT